MASKFTVGTPNTLRKVWNIDVEREYRKLSYLFQNPERNKGIITESLRQLKLFTHQQSSKTMFHCFFGENVSEFEITWKVIRLLLELVQNVMKQNDVAFAKVVWIQIANLIKTVQFRCGSKFTVLPTDGKNSDKSSSPFLLFSLLLLFHLFLIILFSILRPLVSFFFSTRSY